MRVISHANYNENVDSVCIKRRHQGIREDGSYFIVKGHFSSVLPQNSSNIFSIILVIKGVIVFGKSKSSAPTDYEVK